MTAQTGMLTPGFHSPVHDAQRVFRAVLDALARPLMPQRLDVVLDPPAPLSREVGAIALALCDEQTPIWLDSALTHAPDVAGWIRFHTGAPLVEDPADALFCIASGPSAVPAFDALNAGTDEEPHLSATVLIDATDALPTGDIVATGPGIDGSIAWDCAGASARFLEARRANIAMFPRGIDAILAARGTVVGLPRTTVTTQKEKA